MFRRANTTPLQTQHTRRQAVSMWSRGPKQSARTKNPRHFLHQQTRLAQVFENLGGRDHVEVFRRKLGLLEFTVKDFETERTHMLGCLPGHFQTLRVPTVLACCE